MCSFLELGGETRSAVRHLSTSYKGLPLMINTMIEWLQLAGNIDVFLHNCRFVSIYVLYCIYVIFLGRRKKEIHTQIEDHLKTVILKHFDPKKADLIFTEEGSVSYLMIALINS